MISGQDLYQDMDKNVKELNSALSEFRKRGESYAQARRDYQVALSKEILSQRDKGTPVTIIGDICRGMSAIADLRLKKDIAEALYKSAGEAINVKKMIIRVLEEQIKREWSDCK
jgi:Na+/phosphate symporter